MGDVLKPRHETLQIRGRLSYGEGNRAWNTIRLKKDLLREFPQLKERREKFGYKMIMHRSFKELKEALREMEIKGEAIPILLLFYKEEK